MEIGNGGAGPFYGLFSLEENEEHDVNLNEDFPFDEHNLCLLSKYYEYDDKIENAIDDEEEQTFWDLKESLIEKEYINATKGITFLCHEGCGMYNVLVLRGKEKGNVWWFNFSDDVGVVPISHPKTGKKLNFLDWYELWLDENLKCIKGGKKPFGSYGEFVRIDNI